MPRRTLKRLNALSERTGTGAADIIAAGIDLYEKHFSAKNRRVLIADASSKLSKLVPDADKREIFQEVMSAMAKRTASSMTAEERTNRAKAGAAARHGVLTPEQRKAQAKKAAAARWGKK